VTVFDAKSWLVAKNAASGRQWFFISTFKSRATRLKRESLVSRRSQFP
jgi:hypothetical protein